MILLWVAMSWGDEPLKRFEHTAHQRALDRADVPCTSCHQVGAPVPAESTEDELLFPSAETCHSCHTGDASKGLRRAPGTCATCHESVSPPPTHGAGWVALHGADARAGITDCSTCHEAGVCVDCHDRNSSLTYEVHDRSWLSVHGIAAFAQPAECSTCHTQSSCLACHEATP
ncbi:MAG: hypothetical protein GY913_35910 [Proteobacteria bacterium]|nr:hypothetical protein [Pseudomonadota bacterium]MCP4922317.1 hypothetical protein [Pseudomonadota bacterium]